ncbi:ABC transporter permease [Mesorhizobium sp.]|uniref:ABC transporter permease n=1 Tax=Mesorhizobium sp. TaxID=1871066 RepID=UPI000FE3B961|nr:ABC transporter permease [Mesorhizobium sp.]RWA76737.1 MAG: ABC transporter permease [Mesorhizobium sp.]RWC05003.1 MAG: ABC transporter permease [Mesorhizobium sp.]RWG78865.1 MAG: ABC transporter permease [Mesorhizobium sp.]RWG82601.1 MAG: ABC transporter permease [Mesorhizobium sp.]RWK06207.1 MAG: ABC transporter permease [Mesorhizobium sp.]
MASASQIAEKAERDDIRSRWLLSAPALLIVLLAAVGPLLIVVVYSFLTPGNYGDVKWQFSTDAWISVLFERDVFDDTLSIAGAHLSILWRSASLSVLTTILTVIFGFPTAYFIATRPEHRREIWLFLITIPFWTNLLIRTFAMQEVLRNDGIINSALQLLRITDHPVQFLYTNVAVLLGMVYVFLPLMVLPLYASMEKIDFRLVEAGYDLYATRFQVLRHIIIPLVTPGIVAGSILVFIPSLGAYVTPRVLGGGTNLMIGNLVELQFGQGRNWPLGAALSIALMAIVMVALLVYVRNTSRPNGGHG